MLERGKAEHAQQQQQQQHAHRKRVVPPPPRHPLATPNPVRLPAGLKAAQQLIGDYDIYSNANQNGRCPTDGACPIIGKRDSDIDVYASCLFLQWTDGCTVQDCNNV